MSIRLALFILSFMYSEHSVANHKVIRWLRSPRITNWGEWGSEEFCPTNTWVAGMALKIQPTQGPLKDDTGLNAIQLRCRTFDEKYYGHISSKRGQWGRYRQVEYCPNGFATGFQLRSETPQGTEDDAGATNFKLKCTNFDGTITYIVSDEIDTLLPWGNWSQEQNCPANTAICGIVTQVETCQGGGNLDDTALNNVDLACCKIVDPSESCQLYKKWEVVTMCPKATNSCDVQFITGIKNQSNHSIFNEKIGFLEDFSFVQNQLQLRASENISKKLNEKSMAEIINETEITTKNWSIQVNCEGIIQQLVFVCDFYQIYTKEYRCIPDEGFQGKDYKGLFFQPMTASENIFWSYNCEFNGGNITSLKSRSEECGDICFDIEECKYFTWSRHQGGACWIKGSGVILPPVEKNFENLICGWIERT